MTLRLGFLTLTFLATACGGSSGTAAPDMTAPADLTTAQDDSAVPPGDDGGTPGTCDPIKQTGCSGSTPKCTAIDDGNGGFAAGCVATIGTKAVGAACTPGSASGMDDCAGGLICSVLGPEMTTPAGHCAKFCTHDTDCGAGALCVGLLTDDQGNPTAGYCVASCTVFATDCPSGTECTVLQQDEDGSTFAPSCRSTGSVAAGADCNADTDCVAGAVCFDAAGDGSTTCVQLCNDSHACPSGMQCMSETGFPSSGGICQ